MANIGYNEFESLISILEAQYTNLENLHRALCHSSEDEPILNILLERAQPLQNLSTVKLQLLQKEIRKNLTQLTKEETGRYYNYFKIELNALRAHFGKLDDLVEYMYENLSDTTRGSYIQDEQGLDDMSTFMSKHCFVIYFSKKLCEFLRIYKSLIELFDKEFEFLQQHDTAEDEDNLIENEMTKNADGLLYPVKNSHKLILLKELGLFKVLQEQVPNSNAELGRLIAVILDIKNQSEIGTITRSISYLGNTKELETPKAMKVVTSILAQFGIKPKKQ